MNVIPPSTTTAKLEAIERAIERARKNHLAVVATQELGGVKREARALLQRSPMLKDLVPTYAFARDEHAATGALVAALERARPRVSAMATAASARADEAKRLLSRAEVLKTARAGKADAKGRAIALLREHFTSAYERHLSWIRRQVRTEHAPSQELAAALRAALSGAPPSPHGAELGALLSTLDSLAIRTSLKADINAFLDASGHGLADLRPRRWLRTDHAPTDVLVGLLEALEAEYRALGSESERQRRLAEIDALVERLTRRRAMKTERDDCLRRARELRRSLEASAEHVQEMLAQIETGLRAYEERGDALRRRIAEAARDHWHRQVELEDAQRALEVIGWCADMLDDDFTLPETFEALTLRRAALAAALSGDRAPLEAARRAVRAAREDYERALARGLEAGAGTTLPANDALKACQTARAEIERRVTLAQLELDLLSAVSSGDALEEQLARALASTAATVGARLVEHEAAATRAARAVVDGEAAIEALENELGQSEAAVHDAVQVRRLCLDEHAAIGVALSRYHERKREYRDTDALVHYVASSEDLSERLRGIARLLRGRRDSVDSMGSVRLALLIDAGVRAGVELGFLDVTAELRLTVLLEGTLAVLDSREVMFESHLGLFISAAATASLGLPAVADELGAGDLLPVPDLLAEASARCQASVYDARACTVYANEQHWAARWAHSIARRQAFLRRVKLTRAGFETLNESWLDAQIASLAREDGALAWLSTLSAALGARPREIEIAVAERFEGRAAVKLGEHQTSAGDDGGSTRYRLVEAQGPAPVSCEVVEHSLDFVPKKTKKKDGASPPATAPPDTPPAPSGFRGTTVYHALDVPGARPRGRTEPRAFLEVTMIDAHGLSLGPFRFEAAATAARALQEANPQLTRQYRALATSLDAEPADGFDRVVKLPGALEEELEPSAAARAEPRGTATALARMVRLRLDLLVARGEPAAITKLLGKVRSIERSIESTLESAAEKADKARALSERLDELLRVEGAELAASVPLSRGLVRGAGRVVTPRTAEVAELARLTEEKAELLQETIKSRVAEIEECLTLLDNSHAAYARYVRSFRCSAPGAATSLAWEPAWVAQVHRGVCRRRFTLSAEKSFSVLPLVKVFVGTRVEFVSESTEFEALGLRTFSYLKSLATSMTDEVWRRWWDLHMGEVFDICARVTEPGSVPFSEVVLDALEGRVEVRQAARELGAACWEVFRTDENPFAAGVFGEPMVVKALQGRLGASAHAGFDPAIAHAPVLPLALPNVSAAEAALTRRYLEATRVSLLRPWLLDDTSGARSVEWFVKEALATLERSEHLKRGLVKRHEGAGVERSWLDEARGSQQLTELLTLLCDSETRSTRAASGLSVAGPSASQRVAAARALFAVLEAKIALYARIEPLLTAGLAQIDPVPLQGEGSDVVVLLAEGAATVAAVLREPSRIPTLTRWKSVSAVTFLMRSGATERLDRAVARYHESDRSAPRFDGRIPASLDAAMESALVHVEALHGHLRHVETLSEAVRAWYGDRDESASRRAPAVAAVLELPLLATRRQLLLACAFLLLRIELARRVDALHTLGAGIDASERRAAIVLQRASRHRQDVRHAERLTETTVKLQRLFRARKHRLEHGGTPLETLKRYLLAYLRAGAADFRHDQLVHGRKKTLLRGERFPLHEVPAPSATADEE